MVWGVLKVTAVIVDYLARPARRDFRDLNHLMHLQMRRDLQEFTTFWEHQLGQEASEAIQDREEHQ